MSNPELVERVAVAISGAPFPSKRAIAKAQAALKAHSGWLAEQGLVVVPKAVTAEMLRVGMNGPNSAWVFVEPDNLALHWQAMISAALQQEE